MLYEDVIKKSEKFEFNRVCDPTKVDEKKVNRLMKKSIKILRENIYPNLNDSELENFNNRFSKFLFF